MEPNTCTDVAVKPQTTPTTADNPTGLPAIRTAQERRDEYVGHALDAAYAKASELKLTPEETTALIAPFPDEAVYEGAAGDERLLYITHAYIEERLNTVIGLGQWALIPRQTRQERGVKKDKNGNDIVTVYVDCVLMVRGCFVGEDWAEMDYIPSNAKMGYSDAFSGAQSNALRRIAGKRFQVGSQVWKKDWCEGWKQRNRGSKQAPPKQTTQDTGKPTGSTAPQPQAQTIEGYVTNIVRNPQPKKGTTDTYRWKIEIDGKPFYTWDTKKVAMADKYCTEGKAVITAHEVKGKDGKSFGNDIDTLQIVNPDGVVFDTVTDEEHKTFLAKQKEGK